MDKKELTLQVIERLKKEYPEAKCTLDYDKAWQLLVSVRLAAQCTDARVDQITPLLYEKFPSVAALAEAETKEIEKIVRPCGLGPSKARDISACMKVLHENGKKERQPDYGRCIRKARYCHGYPLHPALQPDRYGGRHKGARQSRAGALEDRAPGGRK